MTCEFRRNEWIPWDDWPDEEVVIVGPTRWVAVDPGPGRKKTPAAEPKSGGGGGSGHPSPGTPRRRGTSDPETRPSRSSSPDDPRGP